ARRRRLPRRSRRLPARAPHPAPDPCVLLLTPSQVGGSSGAWRHLANLRSGDRVGPDREDRDPRRSAQRAMRERVSRRSLRTGRAIFITSIPRGRLFLSGPRGVPRPALMTDDPRDDQATPRSLPATQAPDDDRHEPAGAGGLVRYDPLRAYM